MRKLGLILHKEYAVAHIALILNNFIAIIISSVINGDERLLAMINA